MLYEVTNLELGTSYLYTDRGFCALIGVTESNFANRWRLKTTLGLTFGHKWYIKIVNVI